MDAPWKRIPRDYGGNMRQDHEIIPQRNGQRISLSPDEVERLQELGYRVEVQSISSLTNGRRWCRVWFA
jgi:hypothetical protein